MNSGNTSSTGHHLTFDFCSIHGECHLDRLDMLLLFGYIFVLIVGSVGNAIVIRIFREPSKHGEIIELLIFNLAVFDLITAILVPCITIYDILTCHCAWHFGLTGCKIIPVLSRMFPDISVGILLIMAIDRFQLIVRWRSPKFSRSTIKRAISATVLLSLLSQMHYILSLHLHDNGTCVTWVDDPEFKYPLVVVKLVRISAFLLIFWISTIASEVTLHRTMNNRYLHSSSEQCTERFSIMKILVVMVMVFTLTVIPRDLLHLAYTISYVVPGQVIPFTHALQETNKLLQLLAASNCIFNVFIYAKLRENFMVSVKLLLTCKTASQAALDTPSDKSHMSDKVDIGNGNMVRETHI